MFMQRIPKGTAKTMLGKGEVAPLQQTSTLLVSREESIHYTIDKFLLNGVQAML